MKQSETFCQNLLSFFDKQSTLLTNLVLTLAGRQYANSVVSLSLEDLFNYQYSSISAGIHQLDKQSFMSESRYTIEYHFRQAMNWLLPPPIDGRYYVLATDVSSIARPHSPCLPNREYVYKPNKVIKGNKPITLGYRLSCVGLSARTHTGGSWMLPLSMQKIAYEQTDNQAAIDQISELLEDEQLPFKDSLTVNCADSKYSNVIYVNGTARHPNLVNIIRFASNRVVFRQAPTPTEKPTRGHPQWYGDSFRLAHPDTWHEADQEETLSWTTRKGRQLEVRLKRWNHMLVTGKRDYPMHDKPFDLVRIEVVDAQTKQPVYKRPMWLAVWGKRRSELSLKDIYQSYKTRFDIEHFFRFGKQKLLLQKYQTISEQHTQNWWHIVQMAYWLLYAARKEAQPCLPKWQSYKTSTESDDLQPAQVQKGLPAIIRDFVKTHLMPKARNKSSGRKQGTLIGKKTRHKVVKKSKNKAKKKKAK